MSRENCSYGEIKRELGVSSTSTYQIRVEQGMIEPKSKKAKDLLEVAARRKEREAKLTSSGCLPRTGPAAGYAGQTSPGSPTPPS